MATPDLAPFAVYREVSPFGCAGDFCLRRVEGEFALGRLTFVGWAPDVEEFSLPLSELLDPERWVYLPTITEGCRALVASRA